MDRACAGRTTPRRAARWPSTTCSGTRSGAAATGAGRASRGTGRTIATFPPLPGRARGDAASKSPWTRASTPRRSKRSGTRAGRRCGCFQPSGEGDALLDHAAAAERHRHAAHGPRVPAHAAGRADPLAPHARLRHPVADRHRPCRHRHRDGGRPPARARRQDPPRPRPRAFIERVWEWKQESGSTITRQMRRLGTSGDWSRERFTMDEGLSAAVRRDLRAPVRRGPDLSRPAPGQLGPGAADRDLRPRGRQRGGDRASCGRSTTRSPTAARQLVVATTRPETMLGDVAVAVHPEDERYRAPDRQARCACR